MDFIKEILEKAVYVEGKIDIDATMKLVNVEFPKHAVSKADFNAKIEVLKTATATIETLKKDNTTNRVTISVDENTGKIIGMQEMMSKETGGYTQKIADSTNEMAESERKSYDIINNALGVTMDCNGRVVDSNDRVVDSMRDIKTATDGTTTGIIELNGTPYEIQVEKNGTLSALREINNAADDAAKDRTIYINTITTSTQKWMDSNQVNGHHYNGLDNVPYDG